MAEMAPGSRPKAAESEIRALLAAHGVTDTVALVGVRGYYRDTLGVPGRNDYGIYDDAIFVVSPTAFAAFNANTDPSVQKPGVATLAPGVHRYRKGRHGISRKPPYVPYAALRPATPGERLPVIRDGRTGVGVALNIHRGSRTSTSSAGCQTVFPDQWAAFQKLVYGEMDRHGQATVPYLLVKGPV